MDIHRLPRSVMMCDGMMPYEHVYIIVLAVFAIGLWVGAIASN